MKNDVYFCRNHNNTAMKYMYNSLTVLSLFLVLFSCKKDDESTTKFNCLSGNCVEDTNGSYSSLSDCQSNCGQTNTNYNCVSGDCIADENGTYSSLSDCQNNCGSSGQLTSTPGAGVSDSDGNNYSTIVLSNGQEWMSENLKTTKYANGDPITHVTDDNTWGNLTTEAYCWYENDNTYENPYGKLYNWYAVNDSRNVCPTGWHVPTHDEWTLLISSIDDGASSGNPQSSTAGGALKSTGTQYWNSPNTGATNDLGFNGEPGGFRIYNWGTFSYIEENGYWWSSTEASVDNEYAHRRGLSYDNTAVINSIQRKSFGFSVRCVKD